MRMPSALSPVLLIVHILMDPWLSPTFLQAGDQLLQVEELALQEPYTTR